VERLKERIEQARAALATLEELCLDERPTSVVWDAAIQRFEYSFEAVWKTSQRYLLVVEGRVEASPKPVVRASVAARLLEQADGRMALKMVDDRNLTSHTYIEALAQRIFSVLSEYASIMRTWLNAMGEGVARQ